MTQEKMSNIDRANEAHERGTQRVSQVIQQGRLRDPKKPEWIEPKTFVEQLEQGQQDRLDRTTKKFATAGG